MCKRDSSLYYRGWLITRTTDHNKPHWIASKNGVSMNTNSESGIQSMIDHRITRSRRYDGSIRGLM